MFKYLFLCLNLVLATGLHGADDTLPGAFPGERVVHFGHDKGLQTFKDLVIADHAPLHTKLIYARRGLVFKEAKGLVLIYPGTSGRVDSEYGIERSLAPIANELVKRGYAVIAFQPPIYFQAETSEKRAPWLEHYGTLEGNLKWYQDTIRFAESKVPAALLTNPNFAFYSVNRSTFAAVGLEALHRYARGDSDMTAMAKIKAMVAMGLDGHAPDEIAEWHASEKEVFLVKHPEKGDPAVVMAAPQIFAAMTAQSELVAAGEGGRPMPAVVCTVGSRDEFSGGRVSKLLRPVLNFAKHHPAIAVTLAWHDGYHDPGRQISELGRSAGPMARMRLVLDKAFGPAPDTAGLQIAFLPEKSLALAPLSSSEQSLCRQELLVLGGLSTVL